MNKKYPFACALLAASLLPAGSVFAASIYPAAPLTISAQQVFDAKTNNQDAKTVTPIVQATLDKLLQIEPALKQLHIISVHTEDSNHTVSIAMSDNPDTEQGTQKYADSSTAYMIVDGKTGDLLLLNTQIREWASESLPTVSAAKAAAKQFADQLLTSAQKASLGEPESHGSGSSRYQQEDKTWVTWAERTVEFPYLLNGIPVTSESALQIGVSAAGHISSFRYSPPDITGIQLPKPSDAVPEGEIKKQLITPGSVTLSYAASQPARYSRQNGPEDMHPTLGYYLNLFVPVDAKTGKLVNTLTGREAMNSDFQIPIKDDTLIPAGGTLPIVRTKEEAANALKEILHVDVSNLNYEESQESLSGEQKAYGNLSNYSWTDMKGTFVNIMAEKKTGQIINLSMNPNNMGGNKKPTLTQEQAYQHAAAVLSRYVGPTVKNVKVELLPNNLPEVPPSWVDKSKLPHMEDQNKQYLFVFTELHNGIPVEDRRYSVAVDSVTGSVTSLFFPENTDKVELPDAKNIISKEKAAAVFINHTHLKLQYMWPNYYGQRAPSPVLTYVPDYDTAGFSYVDAITGTYKNIPFNMEE